MDSDASPTTRGSQGTYHAPGGRILIGPLLTQRAFAARSGMTVGQVRADPCILRIDSPLGIEPAYPAFMLDERGLRTEVAFISLLLRRRVTDLEACDWLARPHPLLSGRSPLQALAAGLPLDRLVGILPEATRALPPSTTTDLIRSIREEWLRYRGDEETPGLSVSWERLARRATAAPHGV